MRIKRKLRIDTGINNKGMSRGELEVFKVLRKLDMPFFRETMFKDCKGDKRSLPFDFSVVIEGEVVALIEYNGVNHYIPSFGWDDYLKIMKTDTIKVDYCKENNIPLLQIPYNKFDDVDKLVTQFLQRAGAMKKLRLKKERDLEVVVSG